MNILDGLNEMQRLAVTHTEGPLLILAGAGSGKTRTIIHRIAYILTQNLAKAYQVLALTFTNKAAGEMKSRIGQFDIDYIDEMWMGTFHSICARILRRGAEHIGYTKSFTIYDETDAKRLASSCLKELNIDEKKLALNYVRTVISNAKGEYVSAEQFSEQASMQHNVNIKQAALVYSLYQKKLAENNAMDFDDLLYLTVKLLRTAPEIREYYQNRFKYILVDEYQDTNHLQYEIAAILAEKSHNLCVCGDDDQSIYSWRGADIRNILDFEEDFPDAKTIRLEQNYRSTKCILDASNSVIAHNTDRKGKKLWTNNDSGELIHLTSYTDDRAEADEIAKSIKKLQAEGADTDDIAILCRVNSQTRSLEEGLDRAHIRYQIVSGIKFNERAEIKDIFAYLQLAVNNLDTVAFLRAIAAPKRGIGPSTLEKLTDYANFKGYNLVEACASANDIPQMTSGVKKKLGDFAELVNSLFDMSRTSPLADVVETAISESGYIEALQSSKLENVDSRIENLKELVSKAADFDAHNAEATLEAFLEENALLSSADELDADTSRVRMLTIHSAKGLEFDTVFIPGMENGSFPLERAIKEPEELEEERRLCYVAITRARKRVYISYAARRMVFGKIEPRVASMFIKEIPSQFVDFVEKAVFTEIPQVRYPQRTAVKPAPITAPKRYHAQPRLEKETGAAGSFTAGDRIRHPLWGEGTVVAVAPSGGDTILTAAFTNVGIKKFMTQFVKIEKL